MKNFKLNLLRLVIGIGTLALLVSATYAGLIGD